MAKRTSRVQQWLLPEDRARRPTTGNVRSASTGRARPPVAPDNRPQRSQSGGVSDFEHMTETATATDRTFHRSDTAPMVQTTNSQQQNESDMVASLQRELAVRELELDRMRALDREHAALMVQKQAELQMAQTHNELMQQRLAKERQNQEELEESVGMLNKLLREAQADRASGDNASVAALTMSFAHKSRAQSLILQRRVEKLEQSLREERARAQRHRSAKKNATRVHYQRLRSDFHKKPQDMYAAQAAMHRALREERVRVARGPSPTHGPKDALVVALLRATGLPKTDTFGLCDPYMVVECGEARHTSKVRKVTLEPVWNEVFELQLTPSMKATGCLHFTMYDWESFGDDELMGSVTVPFEDIIGEETTFTLVHPQTGASVGALRAILAWGLLSDYQAAAQQRAAAAASSASASSASSTAHSSQTPTQYASPPASPRRSRSSSSSNSSRGAQQQRASQQPRASQLHVSTERQFNSTPTQRPSRPGLAD